MYLGPSRHTTPWEPADDEEYNPEDPWNLNGTWDQPTPLPEPQDPSGVPLPGRSKDPRLHKPHSGEYNRCLRAIYVDYELETGRPYKDGEPLIAGVRGQDEQCPAFAHPLAATKPILENNAAHKARSTSSVDLSRGWPTPASRARPPRSVAASETSSAKENTNKDPAPRSRRPKYSVASLTKIGESIAKPASPFQYRSKSTVKSNGWPNPVPRARELPKAPPATSSNQSVPAKEARNKNPESNYASSDTLVESPVKDHTTDSLAPSTKYAPLLTLPDKYVTEPRVEDELFAACDRSDDGDSSEEEGEIVFAGRRV